MLTLVTGGAASGKSEYAERLITACDGPRVYIATMQPFDAESVARIEKHRAARAGRGFSTIERYHDLKGLRLPYRANAVLLECMSNLAANELFGEGGEGGDTVRAILDGVDALCAQARDVVIVSNELFSDGKIYEPETLRYLDVLSEINRAVAQHAQCVVEVVCGIPVIHKNEGEKAG
ncbi:bifunctional adenosylcobinamide kinase/adenosylcobinamide-phosphate guanylyltransferase [Anaerotruncus sp.]|uniref:bifunctional adenosylcobinamide kinase/adenosylcobinamide-phosphate guanylyltransferase n=1 Tax=Anaerotruncus TaxID=244127 RepID=UPI0021705E65|nr:MULTISPECIES: bifunctional adenosylcobinamide kinase/adenosylcobinamide-phosphate guanylyltransferase [Anaerotruncus]MCI8491856.1 bifunctional adenosylcobinamide kinase/adenosylcobinamide-phosphate guanylyltransferase [Anaerotruncus sp.]